jgi:hypothetical protein
MSHTYDRSFAVVVLALLALSRLSPHSDAASTVFVDFGSGPTLWKTNLDTLMADIGAAPIGPGELTALEGIVLGELDRIYADFDIAFTTTSPPTPTNIIDFTKGIGTSLIITGPSLPKGAADTDWLNRQFFPPSRSYQLAEIFPQEFDDIVDEFSGSMPGARFPMIMQLGIALGGTAAHELGHTYGLYHWDSYGSPSIGPAGPGMFPGEYIIFDSMSIQNSHIMATTETGLMEMGRESPRTLSRYSKGKLEIASDPAVTPEALVSTPFAHTSEIPVPHPSIAMPQPLTSTLLPISGLHAANVHAAGMGPLTPGGGLVDYYVINTIGDGLVTAEVISVGDYAPFVETTLRILDGSGTPIFASDDLSFGPGTPSMVFSTLFGGTDTFPDGLEDDPLVLNMDLPAGIYFVEVALDVDGVHAGPPGSMALFYDLFITSENRFAFVPESSTLILATLAMSAICLRRFRRLS